MAMRHNKMKVGDLVIRTYGEGQRPTGLIVGFFMTTIMVLWCGSDIISRSHSSYLEVIR